MPIYNVPRFALMNASSMNKPNEKFLAKTVPNIVYPSNFAHARHSSRNSNRKSSSDFNHSRLPSSTSQLTQPESDKIKCESDSLDGKMTPPQIQILQNRRRRHATDDESEDEEKTLPTHSIKANSKTKYKELNKSKVVNRKNSNEKIRKINRNKPLPLRFRMDDLEDKFNALQIENNRMKTNYEQQFQMLHKEIAFLREDNCNLKNFINHNLRNQVNQNTAHIHAGLQTMMNNPTIRYNPFYFYK